MSKFVVSIGSRLRAMPVVVLMVFLAWGGLLVISIKLNIADYFSSVFGYEKLPYNEVDPNMAYWIGALPQLIQLAFGVWAVEKGHRMATLVTLCAFIVDMYTDVAFKTAGLGLSGFGFFWPVLLTFIFYTIGSEFLLVASLQNLREYGPDAWAAFQEIFGGLWGHIMAALKKGAKGGTQAAKGGANWMLGDAAPDYMKPQSPSHNQPRRQQGFESLNGGFAGAGGGAEDDADELERAIALAQNQSHNQGRKGMGRDKLRERYGGGNSANGA